MNTQDDTAHYAHLGGLAVGAGLFVLLKPSMVTLFECIQQPDEEREGTENSWLA